jgi:ferrous-iron efflux pump FieF
MKHNDSHHLLRLASYASVGTAAVIIAVKMVGWFMTDSLALLASLVDSVLDIVVSCINLVAIRYALQPPDEEHRFGHGKAEDLAAFTQASFIGFSAVLIAAEAVKRFYVPQVMVNGGIGLWVMVFSTVLTVALVLFQQRVMRVTRSAVIAADSMHYFSDILVNLATMLSLVIAFFIKSSWVDPLFAIGIAVYMLKGAWNILQGAFKNLMDHEFNDEDKARITAIIDTHPEVLGVHEMKTRYSGSKPFIQFHLEMDGAISLYKAHRISNDIEHTIKQQFQDAEIFIHQDPRTP